MKSFFTSLIASISSIEFYRRVLYQPFWEVARFYLAFMVLVTVILTAQYWLSYKPRYEQMIEAAAQEIQTHYPSELIIGWNGTELVSSTMPLLIPFPSTVPLSLDKMSEYLLVIDSQHPPMPSVNTLFVSSTTDLYTVNQGQVSDGIALSDIFDQQSFEINQENLPDYLHKGKSWAMTIITLSGYLFPLITYIFLVFSSLIVLVLDTLLIFLFIKIQRLAISYKQLLQLGLALLVPAQIIDLVSKLAQLDLPVSMLSLSFWILFIVVFFSLQKKLSI